MGIPQSRLSEALTNEKVLPSEVKILYAGDGLTFGAARQTVRLIALLGRRTFARSQSRRLARRVGHHPS